MRLIFWTIFFCVSTALLACTHTTQTSSGADYLAGYKSQAQPSSQSYTSELYTNGNTPIFSGGLK